jgi:hypothetical protein
MSKPPVNKTSGGLEVKPSICKELRDIIEKNNTIQKRVSKLADKYQNISYELGLISMDAHVMSEKARIALNKLTEADMCE